jgi:hypothetical protein
MEKRDYPRQPLMDTTHFGHLFSEARLWDYKTDKSHGTVSNFATLEGPRRLALHVHPTNNVFQAAMRQSADLERDRVSFKIILWPDGLGEGKPGYAVWLHNSLIIGHKLLAIIDPATVPNFEEAKS